MSYSPALPGRLLRKPSLLCHASSNSRLRTPTAPEDLQLGFTWPGGVSGPSRLSEFLNATCGSTRSGICLRCLMLEMGDVQEADRTKVHEEAVP